MPRHFRTLLDLGSDDLLRVVQRGRALEALRGSPDHPRPLEGKSVAIVLEKASTRTRVSFEIGVHELGGHPLTLLAKDTQLGRGEPLEDTARMLSGYVHAIVYRTFGHDRVEKLAQYASVPIINGLSDEFHPCQLLADLMTIEEARGELRGTRVAWIGDGNNMAHSWCYAAALTGMHLKLACPDGYRPLPWVLEKATAIAAEHGGSIELLSAPLAAAERADVITTDVWASMGQEDEAKARQIAFDGFIVDDALMARASKDAIFLHCLPAHRGEEVAASVIDGPQSRVWDEAENRLHGQKALLELLMS
jgi:ornithine carbamoyltransferase